MIEFPKDGRSYVCHSRIIVTELALNLHTVLVGWLVGCFGFYGPLKQYFSLCQAVSLREGEGLEKG